MSCRQRPVITDEAEWNRLVKLTPGVRVTRVDHNQLQIGWTIYRNNLHLVSAMEAKYRHCAGAGIEIHMSGYEIANEETRDNLSMIFGDVAYNAYRWAELCGLVFATVNSLREATVLNLFYFEIQRADKPDGTRFYFIKPLGASAGAAGANAFGVPGASSGSAAGAASASTFDYPVFCWEFFGIGCGCDVLSDSQFTPIQSMLRDEALLQQMIKYANEAESRASNPTVYTVTNPEKPGEKSTQIDYSYFGQAKEMAAAKQHESMRELQAASVQLDQQARAREEAFRRAQELTAGAAAGVTDAGSFFVNTSTGAPIQIHDTGPPYSTYKDALPPGRTTATGPQPKSPPFLTALMELMEKFISQVTGIPAAIYGASHAPVAVNQLVMKSLVAVMIQVKRWLKPIVRTLFMVQNGKEMLDRAWKDFTQRNQLRVYMLELRRLKRQRDREEEGRTTGDMKRVSEDGVENTAAEGATEERKSERPSPPPRKRQRRGEKTQDTQITGSGSVTTVEPDGGGNSDADDDSELEDKRPIPRRQSFTDVYNEKFQVSIVFNSLVDPVEVKMWMDDFMISPKTAIEFAAAYSGQPESKFDLKLLTQAQDAKLKKLKEDAKPDPKPTAGGGAAGGGGGGGGAKKPGGSGGSGGIGGPAPLTTKVSTKPDGGMTLSISNPAAAAKLGSTKANAPNGRSSH